MIYIAYLVIKLTKGRNFKMLLLVILINLNIAIDIAVRAYLAYDAMSTLENDLYERDNATFWSIYVGDLLTFMFIIAVNANTWACYAIRIKEMSQL